MKKEILIENSEEADEQKSSRKKDNPDEALRHKNFMEELEGIKHLMFLSASNKLSPQRNSLLADGNIKEKLQEIKPIVPIPKPIQPQLIYPQEKPKKSRGFMKIFIFPLLFILFASITFLILSIFFQTDLMTKVSASIGAGIVMLIIGLVISAILKKLSKSSAPQPNLMTNDSIINNLREISNFQEIKQCPLCNNKILKSDVLQEGNIYKQYFKCSSASCDFKKEIAFNGD